jgi:hypothetical protein
LMPSSQLSQKISSHPKKSGLQLGLYFYEQVNGFSKLPN